VTGVGDPADGTPQHPDGPGALTARGPSAARGGAAGGRRGATPGDRPGTARAEPRGRTSGDRDGAAPGDPDGAARAQPLGGTLGVRDGAAPGDRVDAAPGDRRGAARAQPRGRTSGVRDDAAPGDRATPGERLGGGAQRDAGSRPGSPSGAPALPARWAQDPFLLDERRWWRPAEVHAEGDAMLLVQRAVDPVGDAEDVSAGDRARGSATMLLGLGPAEPVAALLRAHARRGHRFAWVDTDALGLLRADEVAALGLAPNRTGWEWLVTDAAPAPVAAESRVRELDPRADAAAIRACLADANPTTDADPEGAGERWWGALDAAGRLGGVIGAGPRAGRVGGRGSAHLHGLGVRPGERGLGLGAALTAGAVRALLADGADWVSLGMWDDNHGARRIYHRLGLRTVHRLTTLRARGA
jgi:ribosomal protein S18 acetylase RimI-like enzyme